MPGRMWKHACRKWRGMVWQSSEICPDCGEVGQYDGWHYGMYEAMGRYRRLYGLKPIGLHRKMADRLFDGATFACPLCSGRGLRDADTVEGYVACGLCNSIGRLVRLTVEEFHMRRDEVLAVYPDAAAPCCEDRLDTA